MKIVSEYKYDSRPIKPQGFKKTGVDRVRIVLDIDINKWEEVKKVIENE